jgi:hypothetical protein
MPSTKLAVVKLAILKTVFAVFAVVANTAAFAVAPLANTPVLPMYL